MLQVANETSGKNEKMSKSLNNFVLLYEALEQVKPNVLRMLVLQTHYRSPLVFGEKRLTEAESALSRIENFVSNLDWEIQNNEGGDQNIDIDIKDKFIEAMDDDFNTSKALGHIFEFISNVNSAENLSVQAKTDAKNLAVELINVFGISLDEENAQDTSSLEKIANDLGIAVQGDVAQSILDARSAARAEKNFELADKIRDAVAEAGFTIEDTPQGPRLS